VTGDLTTDFQAALAECLSGRRPGHLTIACSGGGDSTALLVLAANWASSCGVTLDVVTVDHGLRPEAAAEAAGVGQLAARLGLSHKTLRWTDRPETGNLQDNARRARRALIAAHAAAVGSEGVLLGHTEDDVAETFLMRLARGSGVDGLSAMAAMQQDRDLFWLRPLLGQSRSAIREFLTGRDIPWFEDPSNADLRFQRTRIRTELPGLAEIGLSATRLAWTAKGLSRTRKFLEQSTLEAARSFAAVTALGDVRLDRTEFLAAPDEIRWRLLSHALGWVSSQAYRPRSAQVEAVLTALESPAMKPATLAGCLVLVEKNQTVTVTREYAQLRDLTAPATALWDRRWRARAPEQCEIRALGETGLSALGDWRAFGHSRPALLASPALWQGDRFLAAPLLGLAHGTALNLTQGPDHFFTTILSH